MRPKKSELPATYGPIVNGIWPLERTHMHVFFVSMPIPFFPKHIYCNTDMVGPLQDALKNVFERDLMAQIRSFDGCFNIRQSRGLMTLSNHAYGLAIDINAATNQLGTQGDMTPELVKCFTDADFIWGGEWTRRDPMHFQYVTED